MNTNIVNITYRWMSPSEINRIAEIDRSELVRVGYVLQSGRLEKISVDWDVPGFYSIWEGNHSVYEQLRFVETHLRAGGMMIGGFYNQTMVGVGVVTPNIRPGVAQLAYLHVSNGFRRQGIGTSLVQAMIEVALQLGASSMYVSATPSGSAIGFYSSCGFVPVAQPVPELYELEPEDIHMIKDLSSLSYDSITP